MDWIATHLHNRQTLFSQADKHNVQKNTKGLPKTIEVAAEEFCFNKASKKLFLKFKKKIVLIVFASVALQLSHFAVHCFFILVFPLCCLLVSTSFYLNFLIYKIKKLVCHCRHLCCCCIFSFFLSVSILCSTF